MAKLSEKQFAVLKALTTLTLDYNPEQSIASPQFLASLVKRGLIGSKQHSEHWRGEPRLYWRTYWITDAGRAALAQQASDGKEGGK